MAYIYGPTQPVATYKGIRVYIDYSTSQTETTFTLTIKAGFQAYTQAVSNSDFQSTYQMISHANHNVPGLSIIQKTHTSFNVAKNAYYQTDSTSVVINKGTSAQTYTLRYYAGAGGASDYPATLTFTVPALNSYPVTFNANGGTGAPSVQTKYYNVPLTLSNTKPTRTGYAFVRWNTKADGTGTNYNSGASYTANAALVLYAIWEWVYIPHRISNLSATRCNSAGDLSDSGKYAKVSFNWSQAILETGSQNPSAIQVGFKLTTDTDYTYVNVSDLTSGTISVIIGNGTLSEDSTFDIIAVVKSTGHTDVTAETYLSSSYFCIDVSPDGKAIGFGRSAPEDKSGFFCGLAPYIDVDTTATSGIDNSLTTVLTNLGWLNSIISNKVLDGKNLLHKILDRITILAPSGDSLYAAINNVGWVSSVISNNVVNLKSLLTKLVARGNFRIATASTTSATYNGNTSYTRTITKPSSGKVIGIVGYSINGPSSNNYNYNIRITSLYLNSSLNAYVAFRNVGTANASSITIVVYFLMVD